MFNKSLLIIALLLTSFCSCQQTEEMVDQQPFFSLVEYFAQQVEILEQQNYRLEKRININDQSERKTIDAPDYTTELAAFTASDINRPAWLDKYTIDSLMQDGNLLSIRYKAIEETLHTREVNIHFAKNGKVTRISLEAFSHSALSDTKKSMSYTALQNYLIQSTENNRSGDTVEVEIEGNFLQ